ncbi:MAG: ATP-binding protein [Synergistales bacterium]|nr:ATP-binding protein [Synergistales bacterium]MDY6401147.1 ATP-binding protein [Synergistales bacterium]MDY6404740.1 ATP-binding protein [Synergistales bacterium]MDY6409946.1 ATP-binding protein [Synergistales bacterium]MDY6414498.1 ATP-binding protein [Synergistales bacterium]
MANKNIHELLRENNPFASSASPLPWDNNNPDLLQLSREASEDIAQLILYKRREPSVPLAGLVLGEAGSGKTHMLTRILRRLRKDARSAVFVAVKTFRDPEIATRHLLTEIFISLKRIHSSGHTQFDMVMSEFMNSYQERRREDGFSNADINKIDPRVYIAKDIPGLDKNFLKCLVTYLTTVDSFTRNDILDWLSDGLEDDDSLRLGLPSRDLNSMTDARREQEAEKVLTALGLVLAYAKVPMIVCFDQLDAMKDRALISAWGNIISLLMNDLSGILPLCFVRSEIWNDIFVPVLDDAVVQRLRNNTMIMKTCSLAQARMLIKTKIEAAFKENPEEVFQWLIDKMGGTLRDGYSPRVIIELANHAITATKEVEIKTPAETRPQQYNESDIDRAIKGAYDEEYKKIQAEPEAWPPNSEQLALALEVWLNAHGEFEFYKSEVSSIKLAGKYHDKNFAFIITTAKSHFVATAGLKRGIDFVQENPRSFCCYITEKKIHKSTWKIANETLKNFEDSGGHSVMIDSDERIKWYALTALINRIDNGDVNLYLPSGSRTAVREDLTGFLKNDVKLIDFPFSDDVIVIDNPTEGRGISLPTFLPDAKALCDILSKLVETSPMRMLALGRGVKLLSRSGIKMTADGLVDFVKNEPMFKIYKQDDSEPIISFSNR